MENPLKQLKEAEKKIIRVLNGHAEFAKENKQLKSRINELEKQMAVHKQSVKQLEEKIKEYNLAQSLNNNKPDDNRKLKQKINEYIREIDKCIALMNH